MALQQPNFDLRQTVSSQEEDIANTLGKLEEKEATILAARTSNNNAVGAPRR